MTPAEVARDVRRTRPEVEAALRTGLRWLLHNRKQPAGAFITHFGIDRVLGPWWVQITLRGIVVVQWDEQYRYFPRKREPKTCSACGHHDPGSLPEFRPIGEHTSVIRRMVTRAARAVGGNVGSVWNGGKCDSYSLQIIPQPARGPLMLLKTYGEGCRDTTHQQVKGDTPHYEGTVFCSWWWNHKPEAVLPKGWR